MTQPSSSSSSGTGRVDHDLLAVYLGDHLAGAVAGSRRMRRTADALSRTPVGPAMDRVAHEVVGERETLRLIGRRLDLHPSWTKQAATFVAELVGRLKLNGRLVRRSPMTPLLEVELLRSAVTGKLGIWQTLLELAGDLGLDPEEIRRLVAQTQAQIATLDEVHGYLRARALLKRTPGA